MLGLDGVRRSIRHLGYNLHSLVLQSSRRIRSLLSLKSTLPLPERGKGAG
jgi:hypothetical protein